MKFECKIDTDKGGFIIKSELTEVQAQYLIELGYRYLLSVGALSIPDKVRLPEKESENDSKRTLN